MEYEPPVNPADLPKTLTMEQAFRAAFFMIEIYGDIEHWASQDIADLHLYMRADPARLGDWYEAVRRALKDPTVEETNLFSDSHSTWIES
jgi:hypothetical protein